MKKTAFVALAMLLSATSASLAWSSHHSMRHHRGLYNYAPGGAYHPKGGPGPRVQGGQGTGAGAESGTR